ncbi:Kinesin light chain [Coniochaeta hoffmannii]|uniref:Kinesin light chain n=1 Tax=Coniochaeta hoffmannii TaxID=91930 RepID=A0AA38RB36_9PEZI|nr:Kinesin light chain [Coniochaeta hoffmannii]
MRQLFRRRQHTAAGGAAAEQQPSEPVPASASVPHKTFPSGIKPLRCPESPTADVVFVHGLTGDREKTWTARGTSEPWPKALLPSELPTARVLTFGYDAYVADWRGVVSQNRIGNHAWNLLWSLASYRERDDTNERPIIFVCHSLGGLVCEDALVRSRERHEPHLQNILRSTRGIAFLGTPHHGAGLARWAEVVSRAIGVVKQTNPEIVAVLQSESEVLARIQDSFHTMVMAQARDGSGLIEISCFYEELPLPGVGQVVPQHSAILPGYIPIGIRSNHMDMARFAAADDPGFVAVCAELRRWIRQLDGAEGRHRGPASRQEESPPDVLEGSQSSSRFLVPYTSNPDFVGRSAILGQVKDQLGHGPGQANGTSQPRRSLYGLGGVGKTQIALAYAYWLQQTRPEVSVFWVHASSAERFRQAYAFIAEECRIPGHDDPKVDVLLLVKRWLEGKDRGRWLMVIDNADDTQVFFGRRAEPATIDMSGLARKVGSYIPDCAHGSVLVTTRNKETGSRLANGKRPIEVGHMDEDESDQLLRAELDDDELDRDELLVLSSRLEYLPLALVQAAAFIQENTIPVSEYLRLLGQSDQQLVDLLSEEFETVGRDSETSRAVTATWILSFEQIQRRDGFAGEVLSLMSLFDRQAIPLAFLSQYNEQQQDQEPRSQVQLTKALGVLKAFCFVTEDKGHGFDMHRLVQLVTRKWLVNKGTMYHFATQAISTVSHNYPYGNHENRAICGAYLAHVYAVLKLEDTGSRDEALAKASLLHCAAGYFDYQGQWKDTEDFLDQATKVRRELLGEEHPDTLTSMAKLASTYRNQGRWKEAESLGVQVMEARKRVLGEEHPSTLTSMANLASTYRYQGRWKEAEWLFGQVIEVMKRVLGEEHPSTLTSMANLASTYSNQGRWNEAEELEVHVMKARKRVLGEDHPDTLASMNNLASTCSNQGRWKEAEELQAEELDICSRVLGEEHPSTLTSLGSLASTYSNQGRWKEAESLFGQEMEARKRVLGEEHPLTLTSMANLASTYSNQGRWKEAEELQAEELDICSRVLGEEHPDTLTSMANLASTYSNQGRWKEAESLFGQVMEARKRGLGEEHPDTLTTYA